MKYTLNITSNNITYKEGDSLLVSFSEPFSYIKSIDSITFDFIPLDTLENGHDIQFRWSYDTTQLDRATGKPHINWSDWVDYSRRNVINPDLNSTIEKILSKKLNILGH